MKNGVLQYFNKHNKLDELQIIQIQLEQDSAKSNHELWNCTLVDYNWSGCPLIEIVTEPTIHDPTNGWLAIKEL